MLEKTVQESEQVQRIMAEVTIHYDASFSVLTWRVDGELRLKASHLPDIFDAPQVSSPGEYQLFNHTIDRDLPIIVYDVREHKVYGKIPKPEFASGARFYVAAPLMRPPLSYIGTLCVVDCCRPRAEFYLRDVRFLEEKAGELVTAAEEHRGIAAAPLP